MSKPTDTTNSITNMVNNSSTLPELPYDTDFARSGILELPLDDNNGIAASIISSQIKPSHLLVAYYQTDSVSGRAGLARVARIDFNGTLDLTFGLHNTGFIDAGFNASGLSAIRGIHESQNGDIFIWGNAQPGEAETGPLCLKKVKASGEPDAEFGENSVVNIDSLFGFPLIVRAERRCVIMPDGTIFAGGADKSHQGYILKLTAQGELDTEFQNTGLLKIDIPGLAPELVGIAYFNEGLIAYGYRPLRSHQYESILIRYDREGRLMSDFGSDGIVNIEVPQKNAIVKDLQVSNRDQTILLTGRNNISVVHQGMVFLLNNDGSVPSDFNHGSPAFDTFSEGVSSYWINAHADLENSSTIMLLGGWGSEILTFEPVMGRYLITGTPDADFTNSGSFGRLANIVCSNSTPSGFQPVASERAIVVGRTKDSGLPVAVGVKIRPEH